MIFKKSDEKYPVAFGIRIKYRKKDSKIIITIWLGGYQVEIGE